MRDEDGGGKKAKEAAWYVERGGEKELRVKRGGWGKQRWQPSRNGGGERGA